MIGLCRETKLLINLIEFLECKFRIKNIQQYSAYANNVH
jgi:hypothetical protein